MPRVARYGQRQVAPTALPGVRRTAHETSLSTGAELSREQARTSSAVGQLASGVGGALAEILEREQKQADEIALLEAENRLQERETRLLYGEGADDPGALGTAGEQAFEMPEPTLAAYDEAASEIAAGLSSRQQEAFSAIALRRRTGVNLNLQRHVFTERQKYGAEQLQAYVNGAVDSAIRNANTPERAREDIARAVSRLRAVGPEFGIQGEVLEEQVAKVMSSAHVGIIDRYIAQDNIRAAELYFEESGEQIAADKLADVEQALEQGKLRVESQTQADAIIDQGGSFSEQMARARELEGELRTAVEGRIRAHQADVERQDRIDEEARFQSVYDAIEENPNLDVLMRSEAWRELTPSQRNQARGYLETVIRGVPVETDLETYYARMQQARDNPEAFATRNLLADRYRLSESDFKSLTGLQLSIRNNDGAATAKALEGFRTKQQIIDDSVSEYLGFDPGTVKPGTPEARSLSSLRRQLDIWSEDFELRAGRKPDTTEIQGEVDRLLSMEETVPGSFWTIWPGGRPFSEVWQGRQVPLIGLGIEDVPADRVTEIKASFERNGLPAPSDAVILETYLSWRAGRGGGE